MSAPAIIATSGATDANSYGTLAEANAYFDGRPFCDAWRDATTDDQTRALIQATLLLDSLWTWEEYPTNANQAREFPRTSLLSRNRARYLDSDEIPPELKYAQFEFGLQLIQGDLTLDNALEVTGLKRMKASTIELEFYGSAVAKVVPDAVMNFIPDWWGRLNGGMTVPVERW